jgi:hypothetical protein
MVMNAALAGIVSGDGCQAGDLWLTDGKFHAPNLHGI